MSVGDGLDVVSGGAVTGLGGVDIDVQCWLYVIFVWRLIVACCGLGFGGRVWVCGVVLHRMSLTGVAIVCLCTLAALCRFHRTSASVGGDLFGFAGDSASLVSGRVSLVASESLHVSGGSGSMGFETGSLGLAADGTVSLSSSDSVAVGGASVSVAGAEDVDISSALCSSVVWGHRWIWCLARLCDGYGGGAGHGCGW